MSDIIEIEKKIVNLQTETEDSKKALKATDKEIKELEERAVVITDDLKLNLQNRKFSKNAAEVVDLKEYGIIKEKIEDLTADLAEIKKTLSVSKKKRDLLTSNINLNKTLIKAYRDQLNQYGKIIPIK